MMAEIIDTPHLPIFYRTRTFCLVMNYKSSCWMLVPYLKLLSKYKISFVHLLLYEYVYALYTRPNLIDLDLSSEVQETHIFPIKKVLNWHENWHVFYPMFLAIFKS